MKKFVAFLNIGCVAGALLVGIFEGSIDADLAGSLYMLVGLGLFVGAIWSSVILLRNK